MKKVMYDVPGRLIKFLGRGDRVEIEESDDPKVPKGTIGVIAGVDQSDPAHIRFFVRFPGALLELRPNAFYPKARRRSREVA